MSLFDEMMASWDAMDDAAQCPICGVIFESKGSKVYCKSCGAKRGKDRPSGPGGKAPKAISKKFLAWDGEGEDGKYTLLANSEGDVLMDRDGLSTKQCLDFLLEHGHSGWRNNVWYSFGYDVSMILHDIPLLDTELSMERLHTTNELVWKGYKIFYIPRKIFSVTKGGSTFNSYDTYSFFQKSFVETVESWIGEVPEIIAEGKAARDSFSTWDMDRIAAYNAEECKLLVRVMDKFRASVIEAGMTLDKWYGPGAIAKSWLKAHGIDRHIQDAPIPMRYAVMCGYFGGRPELGGWGSADRIYHYDINSAYPYALTKAPSLSNLDWQLLQGPSTIDDFDLVHVKWRIPMPPAPFQWGPFPYRERGGTIIYPPAGEGWYWGVEVNSALKRFPDKIHIVEAWHAYGDRIYPFQKPVTEAANKRLELKAAKNAAHIPLKLALNSLYGVLAQRKYKRKTSKRPPFQCYIWAGFVTAYTRSMLNDALRMADGRVVCTMTDSVWSLVPLERLNIGPGLGQWTFEEEDYSADFCGAGLYQALDKEGNVRPSEYRSRGFSPAQGAAFDYKRLIADWEASLVDYSRTPHVETVSRRFVGIGLALATTKYRDARNRFVDVKKTLTNLSSEGYSKRFGAGICILDPVHGIHFMPPVTARGDNGMVDMFGNSAIEPSLPYRPGGFDPDSEEVELSGAEEDED